MQKTRTALGLYEELNSVLGKFGRSLGDADLLYGELSEMLEAKDYTTQRLLRLMDPVLRTYVGRHKGSELPADIAPLLLKFAVSCAFPHLLPEKIEKPWSRALTLFLEVARLLDSYMMSLGEDEWLQIHPLTLLADQEIDAMESPAEYKSFQAAFRQDYVYEMMKIHQDLTGFNNLDHVCGVHHLAVFIAKQMATAGVEIDLGRVSGAAAGHDIGKYGCQGSELKRLPYLHYYYTDVWFRKHKITYIGHVALNHSTWDLELENLPVESLVLIYADFRVKNKESRNYNSAMHIYPLDESFAVILSKLDNVDADKEKRYRRVYAKLRDFEDYLLGLGINTDLEATTAAGTWPGERNDYALMQGPEVVRHLKFRSIGNNVHLMHHLRDLSSLNTIIDVARSEIDPRNLREYLRIFADYSTYLSQSQKRAMLAFLYELLTVPEDDIRTQAARGIGRLIARYDEDYRKEIPEDAKLPEVEDNGLALFVQYLDQFVQPDHKIIPTHRAWIGGALGPMLESLFKNAQADARRYMQVLLSRYQKARKDKNDEVEVWLARAARFIPLNHCLSPEPVYDYLVGLFRRKDPKVRIAAMETCVALLRVYGDDQLLVGKLVQGMARLVAAPRMASESYLRNALAQKLPLAEEYQKHCQEVWDSFRQKHSYIFLSNLKASTDWVIKETQIEILLELAVYYRETDGLYTAMHFCNLLKVSGEEGVRTRAGKALLAVVPGLSSSQRNDVVIELMRALESDNYQFSEYIPTYLGRLLLELAPEELDEIVGEIVLKVRSANSRTAALLLATTGEAVAHYTSYRRRFHESERDFTDRLVRMLGILLNGLGNYDTQVKIVAFAVIGADIIASSVLDWAEKRKIFHMIAKKLLTLIEVKSNNSLTNLANAAAFNHIYRFISDYEFQYGSINLEVNQKIAFFPGTFDPFSLSHKQIATAIRDMGYEVYLQIDEFSWSKRTLPNGVRRNIINASIADELNVYIYPEDFPVNIANPIDLAMLRQNFPQGTVSFAAGADVIINASAYHVAGNDANLIATFPHIVFDRSEKDTSPEYLEQYSAACQRITGGVTALKMPRRYVDISSTQIRDYVDENRDISNLVDPLAQKYIYENGYYRREPANKEIVPYSTMQLQIVSELTPSIIEEVAALYHHQGKRIVEIINHLATKPLSGMVFYRDKSENGRIRGFAFFHWVRSTAIFNETKDANVSDYIRSHAVGRIISIDALYGEKGASQHKWLQAVLTETLAHVAANDFDYAFFHDRFLEYVDPAVEKILRLSGFIQVNASDQNNPFNFGEGDNPFFVVNMNLPCTLNLDVETVIKEPFRSMPEVTAACQLAREKLQKSLVELYPGSLLLSVDVGILKRALTDKICQVNQVPPINQEPRQLGAAMCVPFGNILRRFVVPNTVTKTLHSEKLFRPDMRGFTIGPYPHYLSLLNQVRNIRSFNRPVILVDDLLHKGYRMQVLDPLFKQEGVFVQKVMVGLLSGRGKEMMDAQDREVDSVYFIPKLKNWFNEQLLYPFIGGDTIWRGEYPRHNLLPSINTILPYTSPTFIRGTGDRAIYNFSMTCFESSLLIMQALEQAYQESQGRNLTLARMSEVLYSPRILDQGLNMHFDFNRGASSFIENDIEFLQRMERTLVKEI